MSSFFPGFGASSTSTGITVLNYTLVDFAMSPYTVIATDNFIDVNTIGGAITIFLPDNPAVGRVYIIKDGGFLADINNITITTVGGAVLIDALATSVINTQFQSVELLFNGTEYLLF